MDPVQCPIQNCDIFDFMALHVGFTVLHPGGFKATHTLADACGIDRSTRVLDIACGKGTTAVYLAQNFGCQVVGIDISKELITQAEALAQRKGLSNRVTFREADALDLPFQDNEFDIAVSQAMLVLVNDKKRAIEEALRVTKAGGHLAWNELSWKEEPTEEFLEQVSTVICAYCMLNVHTFEGWKSLLMEAGAKGLEVLAFAMEFPGMRGMISDEGIANTAKIMFRYLTNDAIRKRMKRMDRFFRNNARYFGYGIYVGSK